MAFAYVPEIWQEFFDVVSLAAATLTGLLAVALSMNVRRIVASPAGIARAREALISLTTLLTLSIFVLIPKQGRVALGIELIALSIVVFALSLRLELQTTARLPAASRRPWILRTLGLNCPTLATTIAGVSLVTGRFGGLLWLIYTTMYGLVWSTYNAWNLTMPGLGED